MANGVRGRGARSVKLLGRGLLGGGMLCLALGAMFIGGVGAAPNWDPNDNAFLKASQRGSTNPGFTSVTDCPAPPEGAAGDWGWHFVLPGNSSTFVTIDVDFQSYGFHQHVPFTSANNAKQAYVYTPGPDTLLDARAVVTGTQTEFVLSHVCTGTTSSTTTTTTTAPPETTTTTTAPPETTTTTAPPETTTTTTAPPETTTTTTAPPETTTTTTTVLPPLTTTTTTTTTAPPATTTTTAQVLGTSIVPTTAPPTTAQPEATVLGEQITREQAIPRTGIDSDALFPIGLALVLAGTVFVAHGRVLARS